jgi:hypothetical protein
MAGVLAAIRARHVSSTNLQRYGYVILPVFNVKIDGTYHFKGFSRYGVSVPRIKTSPSVVISDYCLHARSLGGGGNLFVRMLQYIV